MTRADVPKRVDGRTARAERTRAAIVTAHLELIGEGDLRPTGERIAERAGVSLRALWTNFKDMETLFEASGARVLAQQDAAYRPISPALPLSGGSTPSAGSGPSCSSSSRRRRGRRTMREPVSAQLRRNRAKHIDRVRAEVEQLFAAELEMAGPGASSCSTPSIAATTWSAWSMLRDGLGLDADTALAVLTRTVRALLINGITAGLG